MSIVNFDHPEEYLFPRWAPKSLAALIGRAWVPVEGAATGWRDGYAEADAVERLTATASSLLSIIEEYMRGDDLDYKTVRKELDKHTSVIEAAETWKP